MRTEKRAVAPKKGKRIVANCFNNQDDAVLYSLPVGAFETPGSFLILDVECCFVKR